MSLVLETRNDSQTLHYVVKSQAGAEQTLHT